MKELIFKIKEILENCAKEKRYITLTRLYKNSGLKNNKKDKEIGCLALSLINDEIYQEKGIIISSLILSDQKYFPIKLFLDYYYSLNPKNRQKKDENYIWDNESLRCFNCYDDGN
jgi:hypothetical protein